ncbi:hypothetical protein [Paraburkholderia azotifigens]|uniref:Uncharacterized protein n=1 Tax=Paraburkholderia azotifigens TaxID=2057004 RepID=A0ABU9QWV5_9BURK|nr:hypothetical protein [Paraburkholderia azotifigens]
MNREFDLPARRSHAKRLEKGKKTAALMRRPQIRMDGCEVSA